MLKSLLSLWVLSLILVSGQAQPDFNPQRSHTMSTNEGNIRNSEGSTTTATAAGGAQSQIGGGNELSSSTVDGVAATSTPANPEDGGGGGGVGATAVTSIAPTAAGGVVATTQTPNQDPAAVNASDAEPSSSGGLSSSAKIGLGVGVGIGAVLIAGAIALFFILRRRRSNNHYRSSGASAQYLRDQPAMASGAPALAGMSEMGRSPSRHSFPRTPSQHSLVTMPEHPAEPQIIPPSQHSIARSPSLQSERASLQGHDRDSLMPTLPPYEDTPSPMEEHPHNEPVSPVSPISPAGSRPPSPLHDHER